MSLGWFEIHDAFNEFHEDQKRTVWEPRQLLVTINKSLEKYQQFISDIEISEDIHSHRTIIKVVINERKYLMEKMIYPTLALELLFELKLKERFHSLNPLIKIIVE